MLAVVLDASNTPINGLSRRDPFPVGLSEKIGPVKLFGIDRATALLIANNAAQHDTGFRDYLEHRVRRNCSEETGPAKTDATCAGELRVGFESMEAYDGVLVDDDRHLRCDDPEAIKYLSVDPKTLDLTDASLLPAMFHLPTADWVGNHSSRRPSRDPVRTGDLSLPSLAPDPTENQSERPDRPGGRRYRRTAGRPA